MLDVINRYANGFVAIPVIDACRRRGLFELLAQQQVSVGGLVARLRANEGHLRVALRLLLELGWLTKTGLDSYSPTSAANLAEQLPNNLRELIEFRVIDALRDGDSTALQYWLELCLTGWEPVDPALAELLDGVLLAPLLVGIHQLGGAQTIEQSAKASGTEISSAAQQSIRAFFTAHGWSDTGREFGLNPAGRYLVDCGAALGTVVSYISMLRHIDDLLFGDATVIFTRDAVGRESHVDRTLNVVSSGSQHQTYFAELEDLICSIFDRLPLDQQPRYVCDMGCGDGSLLRQVYDVVRRRSARGKALDSFPLQLVGVDFNQEALESTARTLAGLPYRLIQGDIGDPERLVSELIRNGITDPENVLHVRSFLDHDRRFLPPGDQAELARRESITYTGVYVAADGRCIEPAAAVQSLVEHLRRWRTVVSKHGLTLLEVHCLRPETVRAAGSRTESLHFDAYHGFSGQQLFEAPVFLMAAAEAGLFPDRTAMRRFPRTAAFTRITLNRLVPQPYTVRHPTPSDLSALQRLEAECMPENLLTPNDESSRRLTLFPQGQAVLEYEGKIVAALYSQRIKSINELLRSTASSQAQLHDPEGQHIQLLGLYVHPDVFGQGLGDQLIDFMLLYFAVCDGVDSIVGVTRCLNYWQHRRDGLTLDQYVNWRDHQGRLIDPMLNFHESHGALVRELVAGFRPEDVLNDGAGVLIEYPIRDATLKSERKLVRTTNISVESIPGIVRECVVRILGSARAAAYGPEIPFMAMGLGSLDLLELRHLLGEKVGLELGPTIFFQYGSPSAVIAYLKGESDAGQDARAAVALRAEGQDESIAVVSLGCHFPGEARGPAAFWTLLENGYDAIAAISSARRDVFRLAGDSADLAWPPRRGGFVSDIDQFDAAFFRISAREAKLMDPQHRLLLEIVWEALEAGGFAPSALKGSATGVFVGAMSRDYEALISKRGADDDFDTYFSTGNASSVAAGRLAYFFDWRGPTLTVDTACSSSLVAVHLACRSLQAGECNLAITAGVNLLLDPKLYTAFGRAGMLAADGRCKTFDAKADGYVRSEGGGVLVLKRLGEARRDGDRILAVIRGSALNQDGASGGLTVPNQISQQEVIERAVRCARVAPHEVSYLEAHGTGTSLGDPIEVQAAAAVLGKGRSADRPLLIGSVKTNIGHLEAAAGIAGLIKVILALEHGIIPRHLHFREPNPHIPWSRLPVKITSEATPWPAGRKIAGVSSFGFSGTNAHVVIEEAPVEERQAATAVPAERSDHVLVLSARDEMALRQLARRYLEWWNTHPDASAADVCYSAGVGRSHLAERAALVFDSFGEVEQLLTKLERGESAERLFRGQSSENLKIAWLFTGEGSQYLGMGKELYDTQPVVREILTRCDRALVDRGECGLLDAIFERETCLKQARYAQPALFALQVALAELWRSWGQTPDVMVGYGAGQYAAAQLAGAFSLEDGLRLIGKRGELIDRLGSEHKVTAEITQPEKSRAREFDEEFLACACGVEFQATRLPVVCSLTGEIVETGQVLDSAYWLRHLGEPARFSRSVEKLTDLGVGLLIEIGPQPLLLDLAEQSWPERNDKPVKVASLRQGLGENRQLTEAVAQLYTIGLTPDFAAWDRPWPRRRIALPTYPFQRTRHWIEPAGSEATKPKDSAVRLLSAGPENGQDGLIVDRCLYQVGWPPRELPVLPEINHHGTWLILADRQGVAAHVARVLAKFGQNYRLASFDEVGNSAGIETVLEDLHERESALTRIIHLWSLDLPNQINERTLATMQRVVLAGTLRLVQALTRRQLAARLHLVTRGACAVTEGEAINPIQAPLWGLGRVIGLELPDLWGGMLDLPLVPESSFDSAQALLKACLASDDEDQIALRNGQRYVARIQRMQKLVASASLQLRQEATYLITGGLGALGLATARWLAEQGATNLVLVSRRVPNQVVQKSIDELRLQTGCRVHVRSCDISQREEVSRLIAHLAENLPPLRGIVHAAGLTGQRLVTELSVDELKDVSAAKVQGTWWLHELTQDFELDFFVGFSSLVSVLGNPGQAHYAAANAFLDSVMWHRQASGLVGTSLNFGPWSGGGMADEEVCRWFELNGVNTLTPSQALAGWGMAQSKVQTVVADLDWARLLKTNYGGRGRSFLAELALPDQVLIKADKTSLIEQLERAPATQRRSILEEHVRKLIGQVLRAKPEEVDTKLGFFDLGMDSLMAMELRLLLEQSVGRGLPATLAMDHPRLGDVVNYLLSEVLAFEPAKRIEPGRNEIRIQDSAVAVVGLASRVPGAPDVESFWRLLEMGEEAIGEIPAERWDMAEYYDPDPEAPGKIYTRHAGLIENVDQFDASLFGIAPREAVSMDPQQRLLLEVAWQALEKADIAPNSLRRTRTGVYVGAGANEYGNLVLGSGVEAIDVHFSTGNALSTVAGRLAFALGLEGPALVVDTACSSSLVAVHQACQALRSGECELALAGGVNLLLSPEGMIATCRARMLAADGHCKTFDAAANGYVRAEGCGVVVLKRLDDAQRDGDRILAVIRGSAVNQDGASSGLTVPNGPSQERVIAEALRRAGIEPGEVSYLEAHGTGTNLGDPIEVQAAAAVLGKGRAAERPLLIGSVKTNIGHLEAAAGIAGLIKVILAIEHGVIPKHLHFQTPNPHIAWQELAVAVTSEARGWPPGRKIAGVSSFGFSGTNAHVVVEEPPAESKSERRLDAPRSDHVLTLSGRTQAALRQLAGRYREWLEQHPEAEIGDVAYTAGVGRSHMEQRAALVVNSSEEARQLLASVEQGRPAAALFHHEVRKPAKVAWFFTGQGSQYVGMGRELYQSQAVVREVLDRCDRELSAQRERGLIEVLFEQESLLNHTSYTQPALYALEVAMAQLWKSWGVEPDVVLGHSVGQYAAAVVAGVMSLEEGLRLIAKRAELMGRLPAGGGMAAVFAQLEAIEQMLEHEPELSVAGYNGAHLVLSGAEEALEKVLAELSRQGIVTQRLNTSHGFHSVLMEPILEEFESYAQTIAFRPAQRSLVCNLTGGVLTADQVLEAGYWRRHIREPVQFARSVQTVAELGVDFVMEMGPQPVLLGMTARCWPAEVERVALVATLKPGKADHHQMAQALAQCYVHGLTPDFAAWDRSWSRRKLDLPTYPFQRTRYWIQSQTRSVAATILEPHLSPNGQTNGRQPALTDSPDSPESISRISESNSAMELLRSIIADGLRCDPQDIDLDRELFQYGFGSLYVIRVVEQFAAATGFRFSPRAFFEHRTIRELVGTVTNQVTIPATTRKGRSSRWRGANEQVANGSARDHYLAGSFPLSEGQKVLWSIQQSNPNSTAYHVPMAINWNEPIDLRILEQALLQLTIEQPALRATFPFEVSGPVQRVHEPKPVLIHNEDLGGLTDAEMIQRIRWINQQAFDLENGPLWRIYVFSISLERSVLLLNFHHLIADGHSFGFLLEELERRYQSIRRGTDVQSRVPTYGIGDSIAIERRYLGTDSFRQDRDYWLNLFPNGFPPPLVFSRPEGVPAADKRDGEVLEALIPRSVIRSLEALASAECVSLQAVFLAAFQALLASTAGREEVVAAVAADTRPNPGFEHVIGFFVNMLPIPATLSALTSFHELLQQVFGRLLEALEHRQFPFRQLVQDLAEAGKNWNELQAAFYFQAWDSPEQRSFADRLVSHVHQAGEFDLVFEVVEAANDWRLNVKYRPSLFGSATIARLAVRFNQLLAAIVASPQQPLVQLIPANQEPISSRRPEFEYPERCVQELIEDRAIRTPNDIAVLFQGQHFTYRQLDEKANQVARYLIRSGVRPGALVGIMLDRSRELLAGLLATWKAGAAYVPLDPSHPPDRLNNILRDAKVQVLLTQTSCSVRPLDLRVVEIDREQSAIQSELTTRPITQYSPDDLAYVIYTSGSTGEPKGVQIAHRSLTHFLWCMAERPGCTDQDYVLASTTICFDIAALELFLPLITGARLEILPEEIVKNGLRLKEKIESSPATLIQATPATWKMLLAAELGRLPRVKALCGGEAWDVDLADQLLVRTRELWNMYGPTETTIWSSIQRVEPGQPVRLGDPIGNTQFYVFDETMRPVQLGEIGELFIGGDGLAKGYLNRPELTRERFVLHPLRPNEVIYRTGDLVRYV